MERLLNLFLCIKMNQYPIYEYSKFKIIIFLFILLFFWLITCIIFSKQPGQRMSSNDGIPGIALFLLFMPSFALADLLSKRKMYVAVSDTDITLIYPNKKHPEREKLIKIPFTNIRYYRSNYGTRDGDLLEIIFHTGKSMLLGSQSAFYFLIE